MKSNADLKLKAAGSEYCVSSSCVEPELGAKMELHGKIQGLRVNLGSSEDEEAYVSVSAREPIR